MTTFLIVSASILLVFATYALIAPVALNYGRFGGGFEVKCPSRLQPADVRVAASRAAITSAYGSPSLRLRRCTLLRPGESCDEACLKGLSA